MNFKFNIHPCFTLIYILGQRDCCYRQDGFYRQRGRDRQGPGIPYSQALQEGRQQDDRLQRREDIGRSFASSTILDLSLLNAFI